MLVQIDLPGNQPASAVKVAVGGRDVSAVFHAGTAPHTLVGLVAGLAIGKNTITVATTGKGSHDASLDVINYPITGPVFSGPWTQPFICQTDAFVLPDGTKLGPALDANCSAKTVVRHAYRTTATPPSFKPLPSLTALRLTSRRRRP